MRQVILVFAALAVVAIGVIAFATSGEQQQMRRRANIGMLYGNGCCVYRVDDQDYSCVVSLPIGWSSSSQSNSGGMNGYYRAQATFTDNDNSLSVIVQRDSLASSRVLIDGAPYDLANGSVFRVRAVKSEGNASKVEVIQAPFAPLEVTPQYADELNEYFKARETR